MKNKTMIISLLLIFSVTSLFGFSIKGKKYKVIQFNDQNLEDYDSIIEMFLEFDDVLTMTVSSMGEKTSMDEEYDFDSDEMTITEYVLDGSVNVYDVTQTDVGITMSSLGSTIYLKEITDEDLASDDEEIDYDELLNQFLELMSDYDFEDYESDEDDSDEKVFEFKFNPEDFEDSESDDTDDYYYDKSDYNNYNDWFSI